MSRFYTGKHALHYNQRWRNFIERTLTETLEMIDLSALRTYAEHSGHRLRVLDVACGTGLLLKRLVERIPQLEVYGVDASADMLRQAHAALKGFPAVYLTQAQWGPGETGGLPYASEMFDLITCTNTLHYLPDPVAALRGLRQLLLSEGFIVLEDYARRGPPFLWTIVERLLRLLEGGYEHAYTLSEAQSLCTQAGYEVVAGKAIVIDRLCHGWVLRLRR
jgi:ubiquinone/menaquinone biosynthesis C-methylase UbiE